MDFHRAHSNSFRLAHDVGTGSGIFATVLADYFNHVHLSDAKPEYIAEAKSKLDKWFEDYWFKARFTFSTTPAEKADEPVVKGSVDCVTMMQCAHWVDQKATVHAIARSLTPNGSLIVVSINPSPVIVDNKIVKEAVDRLFNFWMRNVLEFAGGPDSQTAQTFVPQHNSGVESIPLPEGDWIQDVTKRIDINVRDRGKAAHAAPGYEAVVLPSHANDQHRRYAYTSEDPEGQGWQYRVDAAWFRGYISTLARKDRLHLYEDCLAEVESAIAESTPDGIVVIEWVVAILLATRK